MVHITEPGPPLTDSDIHALECKVGATVPEDYRAFLLRWNGGVPEPEHFPIEGHDRENFGGVREFFGIGLPLESSALSRNIDCMRGRLPVSVLPVGCDGSGNLICLSLGGSNRGCVYFWDHDREEHRPSYRNLWRLADSFTDFLGKLYAHDMEAELRKIFGADYKPPHH